MKTSKFKKRFLSNKTVTIMSLIISVLSLFIAIVSTFYYTRQSNILSSKSRLTNLTDRVYDLVKERNLLIQKTEKEYLPLLSDVQLQTKHLLFEIDQSSHTESLTQAQNRLLAETFETLLYYNYAQKYWDKVFKTSFTIPEIKAEYYRRYGQFLYTKHEYEKGEEAFRKSLLLQNDSDEKRYINLQTYTDWSQMEFIRESHGYHLNRSKNVEQPFPKFTKAYNILKEAEVLLDQFQDYSLYRAAAQSFNRALELITNFKSQNTTSAKQASVQ